MLNVIHSRKMLVALGDVDSARVIYFPAVFRWHEYSFSEWLATEYMPLSAILTAGHGLPVVNCSATYSASIRQDDPVTLQSWIKDVGTSSFTFGTTVRTELGKAANVETRHVWVQMASDGSFSSTALPKDLRELLQ